MYATKAEVKRKSSLVRKQANLMLALNAQVMALKTEWKFLSGQLEKATRYAPPHGEHLRHCRQIERELNKVGRMMAEIEKAAGKFPQLKQEN